MTAFENAGEIEFLFARSDDEITAALGRLIPDLVRYFASRMDDREDAADAAADTLLVLCRRAKALPLDDEGVRRYAFGIARNVLRQWRRSRGRHHALAERMRAMVVSAAPARMGEQDADLTLALNTLKPDDRELVLLVAWEGFSVADAGRILGLRPDAARARYSRARAHVRTQLQPDAS